MKKTSGIVVLVMAVAFCLCSCIGLSGGDVAHQIEQTLQTMYGEEFVVTKTAKNDMVGESFSTTCYPVSCSECLFKVKYYPDDKTVIDGYEGALMEIDVEEKFLNEFSAQPEISFIATEVTGNTEGYSSNRNIDKFLAENKADIYAIIAFESKKVNDTNIADIYEELQDLYMNMGDVSGYLDIVIADNGVIGELKKETDKNPTIDDTVLDICNKGKVSHCKVSYGMFDKSLTDVQEDLF